MYYSLTEAGIKQSQKCIDAVKEEMKTAAINIIENQLGEFYVGISEYIDSDSWGNFKQEVVSFVSDYRELCDYESKPIRDKILNENNDLLVSQLNEDLLQEIKLLKAQVEGLQSYTRL